MSFLGIRVLDKQFTGVAAEVKTKIYCVLMILQDSSGHDLACMLISEVAQMTLMFKIKTYLVFIHNLKNLIFLKNTFQHIFDFRRLLFLCGSLQEVDLFSSTSGKSCETSQRRCIFSPKTIFPDHLQWLVLKRTL